MKTEIKTITPDVAKEMLKRNPNNRKLSAKHVNFLAEQMKAGQWLFDGQPIRVSEAGALLDGQHRLNAIIKSGFPQDFLLISGINTDAFKVMDTGKNRTSGDVLTVNGVPYATATGSAIKLIRGLQKGQTMESKTRELINSNTEVLNFYKQDSENIDEAVKEAHRLYREFDRVLEVSVIAGLMYLTTKQHYTQSSHFWNSLCLGTGLDANSPIRLLRNRLIKDKFSNAKMKKSYKLHLIIKAWNHYRKGNTPKWLKIMEGEKFPRII